MSDPNVFRYCGKSLVVPKIPSSMVTDLRPLELKRAFYAIKHNERSMGDTPDVKACLTTAYVQLLNRIEHEGLIVNASQKKDMLEMV
jgi:hypothetical protein